MTADLGAFLNARLDEEEAAARGLLKPYAWGYSVFYEASQEELAHIERYRPARVLADVQAKRAILASCSQIIGDGINYTYESQNLAEDMLFFLVQPYAGHPDFNPHWADNA